jgi:hypothetical protein
MYRFALEDSGILCIETSGFWDIAEAERYLAELKARTESLRRADGHVLVLVDGRAAQVQSAPVMEKVAGIQDILIVGDRDRAAYIVENSLSKMQAQRLSTTDRLKVFLSPSAARTWLLAYQPARRPS